MDYDEPRLNMLNILFRAVKILTNKIFFSSDIEEKQQVAVQNLPGEAEPQEGLLLRTWRRVQER